MVILRPGPTASALPERLSVFHASSVYKINTLSGIAVTSVTRLCLANRSTRFSFRPG
jgi:hypothetical protein